MLIIGSKEQENETVAIRERDKGETGSMLINDFLDKIVKESMF